MLIGLVGPSYCGKTEVATILCDLGFHMLYLQNYADDDMVNERIYLRKKKHYRASCMNANAAILESTKKLDQNFVVLGIKSPEQIDTLRRRPNVIIVCLESEPQQRFQRMEETANRQRLGSENRLPSGTRLGCQPGFRNVPTLTRKGTDLDTAPPGPYKMLFAEDCKDWIGIKMCTKLADVTIYNTGDVDALGQKVRALLRTCGEVVRPEWDTYFMRLAFLASSRANCLKRRVGAVIVKDCRVLATGYNGTPKGMENCNEGGCARCKDATIPQGVALEECCCVHAEANVLIEAGRERSNGADIFCTTLPCLSCSKLIVQSGIRRVVFGMPYDDGGHAATFLEKAGVRVACYSEQHFGTDLSSMAAFIPREASRLPI